MSARRGMLAVGVIVVALAIGAVSVGAVPVGTAANPERIDFISRATAINNFVDVGPAGPSPGTSTSSSTTSFSRALRPSVSAKPWDAARSSIRRPHGSGA